MYDKNTVFVVGHAYKDGQKRYLEIKSGNVLSSGVKTSKLPAGNALLVFLW